jgi:hypothetical protein
VAGEKKENGTAGYVNSSSAVCDQISKVLESYLEESIRHRGVNGVY